MIFLLEIGFLPVSLWDVFDIIIVGYLIYRIYRLFRGSIALTILFGVATIFIFYWLVGLLKMDMLSLILSQFVNVGFIIIIIIFQPEVRRFLLMLGDTAIGRRSNFLTRWMAKNMEAAGNPPSTNQEIKSALLRLSREKTGALIVLSRNLELETIGHSGVVLDAKVSWALLMSIFQRESPLHDGAVVIGHDKILAAGCILPVSESPALPKSAGLRHRAALGVTERTITEAFIVSEETGRISHSAGGKIEFGLSENRLNELLFTVDGKR